MPGNELLKRKCRDATEILGCIHCMRINLKCTDILRILISTHGVDTSTILANKVVVVWLRPWPAVGKPLEQKRSLSNIDISIKKALRSHP